MGVGTEWCRASGAKEIRGRFGRKGKTGVDADPDRKTSIKTRSVYEIAAARQRRQRGSGRAPESIHGAADRVVNGLLRGRAARERG